MPTAASILSQHKLPLRDAHDLPASSKRFDDGGQYRIEIPSCEGPAAMQAVISEAAARSVPVHRVSQGSGIMLQTDREIEEMLALGRDHGIEVCLFVGPRSGWDSGAQAASSAGRVLGASLRGADQLAFGIEDVLHGVRLGLKSILVGDLGHLKILGDMKRAGDLPDDFVLKTSVTIAAANPATARLLEDLGATSINLPVDLSLAQIAAVRQAIDAPIDFYVESPDDFGGLVRHYETPTLVRVAAPIYLKYGLRNSPGLYPSGLHIENLVVNLSRERVRRAELSLAILERYMPEAVASPSGVKR
ncbi:MAG: U32 family peptidase [Vicinamibacterales bacterium]